MPFSYGKFLAKISSARSGSVSEVRPANAGDEALRMTSANAESNTAAADSLQAQAVQLPDIDSSAALQAGMASAERVEKLLTSLWCMTDDLARIRAEFHLRPGERAPNPADGVAPEGGYAMDERAGVIAQIDVIEGTICSIVAVLAEPEADGNPDSHAASFLRRVDGQRREMVSKAGEALRLLRLQAIQLAAAVHAYRSSLSLARRAIEQARR